MVASEYWPLFPIQTQHLREGQVAVWAIWGITKENKAMSMYQPKPQQNPCLVPNFSGTETLLCPAILLEGRGGPVPGPRAVSSPDFPVTDFPCRSPPVRLLPSSLDPPQGLCSGSFSRNTPPRTVCEVRSLCAQLVRVLDTFLLGRAPQPLQLAASS